MRSLKEYPFFLILIAVFFCLHANVEHYGFLNLSNSFYVCFQILIAAFVLCYIFYFLNKDFLFSAIITFFMTSWYCFFGDIKDNIHNLIPIIDHYSIILPVLIFFTVTFYLYFLKKKNFQAKFTLYLNILLLIYCVVDLCILGFKSFNTENPPSSKVNIALNINAIQNKPNVYYLLFDEYAGYKNLKDSFNFTNDKLYNYLKINKFQNLHTYSNYAITQFCMSSILNMTYVEVPKDTNNLTFKDMQKRNIEIQYAFVFNFFRKMGYTINNFSCFDVDKQQSLESNSFILGYNKLLVNKMLHNRLLKDLSSLFLFGKYRIDFFSDSYNYENEKYNGEVEKGIKNNLNKKSKIPGFVYAHFLIPHSPILFDSLGQRISNRMISKNALIPSETKNLYLSYLKYGNKKIISIVNEIINKDSNAIIIIMSDHGYRDWEKRIKFQHFNFNNICFVRNINNNKLSDSNVEFSNVNFFRYFFNQNFNQCIPYLKDSIGLALFH